MIYVYVHSPSFILLTLSDQYTGLEAAHRRELQLIHCNIHFNTWHLTQWLPWEKTLQEVGLTTTSIQMILHLIRASSINQSQLHLLSRILSAGFNSVDWGCSTSMVHTRLVILLLTLSKHALSLSQILTRMEQFYLLATGTDRTLPNHGCKTLSCDDYAIKCYHYLSAISPHFFA